MTNPATAREITEILGELDTFTIEKILETHATLDEIVEARAGFEDERRFGEPRDPTTVRVASVRAILSELTDDTDDETSMPAGAQP